LKDAIALVERDRAEARREAIEECKAAVRTILDIDNRIIVRRGFPELYDKIAAALDALAKEETK